jgi:hypothetical protein
VELSPENVPFIFTLAGLSPRLLGRESSRQAVLRQRLTDTWICVTNSTISEALQGVLSRIRMHAPLASVRPNDALRLKKKRGPRREDGNFVAGLLYIRCHWLKRRVGFPQLRPRITLRCHSTVFAAHPSMADHVAGGHSLVDKCWTIEHAGRPAEYRPVVISRRALCESICRPLVKALVFSSWPQENLVKTEWNESLT